MFRTIVLALTAATGFGLVGAVRLGAPADAAPPTTVCDFFDPGCLPPTPPTDPSPPPCSPFDPACTPPVTTPAPHPPQHIYVPEHYGVEFNAQPGDTVTVIMDPMVVFVADRCANMGGTIDEAAFAVQRVYYCDGIDF